MFDLNTLPQLIRRDIEHGESNFPTIPDDVPAVVEIDPSWKRQWLAARARVRQEGPTYEGLDAKRQRYFARYLAVVGLAELEMIVLGCTYAATHYEMPAAWRTCLIKQAYEDMQHAASYITRGCKLSGENYWNGIADVPYRENIAKTYHPILRRDLGGFFAAIGLHTEAYPAETNILEPFALDPVLVRWMPNEIQEEAGHLTFLYPAMREYVHSGTPEEQDRRNRQMVADNETLLETAMEANRRNAETFVVGKLGMDPAVMEAFAHIPERTRYIFQTIGIEESYWPRYLKKSD
ncbi:MAG: hypothetical protein AB7P69_00100 [Candidatus Binatia bacterium]